MNRQCRSLSDNEIIKVSQSFTGMFTKRNRALFILGCSTGFKISELLSVQLKDVISDGDIKDFLTVSHCNMKGQKKTRSAFLTPITKKILTPWIELARYWGIYLHNDYLFSNKQGKAITQAAVGNILKKAYSNAGLTGVLTIETMCKTFTKKNIYGSNNS